MLIPPTCYDFAGANGLPAGGHYYGPGLPIAWQNGPVGRGAGGAAPKGAFVESVIIAVIHRITFYQRVSCGVVRQ